MKDTLPRLIVWECSLNYAIQVANGEVYEWLDGHEQRYVQAVLNGIPAQSDNVLAMAAFKSVLSHYGVLAADANRADLGPLPGRYANHPWAQRFVDTLAIEVEVAELLARIPSSVRLQCYHNGEGDHETIALLPFDGWEGLDTVLALAPYGMVACDLVGADVMRLMRTKKDASPAQCRGKLYWQIASGDLPSAQEAARWRKEAEALRNGLAIKQGGAGMK